MQFFALCAYFVSTLFWCAADYWGVKFSNTCNFILNSAAKSKKISVHSFCRKRRFDQNLFFFADSASLRASRTDAFASSGLHLTGYVRVFTQPIKYSISL